MPESASEWQALADCPGWLHVEIVAEATYQIALLSKFAQVCYLSIRNSDGFDKRTVFHNKETWVRH